MIKGVSNVLCEHASSAFIFASTSSDQFCHAISEHLNGGRRALRKYPLAGIPLLKSCFTPSNLADTSKTGQQTQN